MSDHGVWEEIVHKVHSVDTGEGTVALLRILHRQPEEKGLQFAGYVNDSMISMYYADYGILGRE